MSATSFEDGLGGWTAPAGWTATTRVFEDGAVITTPDTVLLGFGLEGLAPAARDDLVRRAMTHLKIKPKTRSGVR
ncbi:hypothetical protein ACH45F_21430 [Catenuloplanes sp. NPDC020197]|uniref:hypothetical protein n=1 Tax=Catenuloplanes sp. NPDC020197 TaxID=3363958 RepID=UPI0037A98948